MVTAGASGVATEASVAFLRVVAAASCSASSAWASASVHTSKASGACLSPGTCRTPRRYSATSLSTRYQPRSSWNLMPRYVKRRSTQPRRGS